MYIGTREITSDLSDLIMKKAVSGARLITRSNDAVYMARLAQIRERIAARRLIVITGGLEDR